MIPLTTLYHDYIDRPKFSEQKITTWIYISSPTKVGWWNNNVSETKLNFQLKKTIKTKTQKTTAFVSNHCNWDKKNIFFFLVGDMINKMNSNYLKKNFILEKKTKKNIQKMEK